MMAASTRTRVTIIASIALLCVAVILGAPFASAADDADHAIGFWARLRAVFGSEPTPPAGNAGDAQIAPQIDTPTCDAQVYLCKTKNGLVRCEGSYDDCTIKYEGACRCAQPEEKATDATVGGAPNATGAPAPVCDRCSAVVCGAEDREFLCPTTLDECVKKHGDSCRELGCDQHAITCVWEGGRYALGDSFPAGDGCNTCTCGEDGTVGCTKRACPAAQGSECKQTSDCPQIACIAAPCPGNVCKEGRCVQQEGAQYCVYDDQKRAPGDTFPDTDGCNTCSCTASGRVVCTERACAPQGSECETTADCPQIACIAAPCPGNVCENGYCVTNGESGRAAMAK